ncbi:hypothetical protein DFP73DRAFT_535819 [Morchella snyderi]|nr:hypothetical protein DFP73DRAFT_535819 [Morchella snyderi]
MAPTDSQIAESDALKAKGNAAFGKQEFTAAHSFYTNAIALTPASPTLYSNRAAALLSMNKLSLALNDANMAIKLNPKWAKAYRRRASVLDAMKRWGEAKETYKKALEVGLEEAKGPQEKEAVEGEILKLVKAIDQKVADGPQAPAPPKFVIKEENNVGHIVMKEFERRIANGEPVGQWPPNGSCLRRIWVAEMQFQNALNSLHQFYEGPIPGAPPGTRGIFGKVQTIEELTTAILEDGRVARFDNTCLQKLRLCFALEQQQRNAIGPGLSPKETINAYNSRLASARTQSNGLTDPVIGGWNQVRPALQLSIRTSLMNGCIAGTLGAPGSDEPEFRRAVDLIEEARKTWPMVDGAIRGRTLEETFLRGVKILLAQALIKSYQHTPTSPSDQQKKLDDIMEIANWVIESFMRNPRPPESERRHGFMGDDAWWNIYYAHYATPLAKAYTFRGFVYSHTGLQIDTDRQEEYCIKAAHEYITAASWMSADEPERGNALWNGIFTMCASEAYYRKEDLRVLADMARGVGKWCDSYFLELEGAPEHLGTTALRDVLTSEWYPDEDENAPCMVGMMRDIWVERIEKYGEKEEAVGSAAIWEAVDERLRTQLLERMGWDN